MEQYVNTKEMPVGCIFTVL